MRRLASWLLFPATLLLGLVACGQLMAAQVNPGMIVGLVSVVTIVIVALAERLLPFRQDWLQGQKDVGVDILHNIMNSFGFREVCKIGLLAALVPVVGWLSETLGSSLWPQSWPLPVQVFAALAIAELGLYAVHRLCHEHATFWRFHMVHHSPKRLYWLNAGRDHPLGVLLFVLAGSTPLILLGTSPEVMTYFFIIEAIHGLFQHANIQLRFGVLNYIFSTAALHRWHHSASTVEANHNYGQTLIIWDLLFGTYYRPAEPAPDQVGLEAMPRFPQNFGQQMLAPFRPYSAFEVASDQSTAEAERA